MFEAETDAKGHNPLKAGKHPVPAAAVPTRRGPLTRGPPSGSEEEVLEVLDLLLLVLVP